MPLLPLADRPKVPLSAAVAVAEKCVDAYSADRFASWPQVALALLRSGFTEIETEAIMRSKWTRWAADARNMSTNCPANAIVTFIDREIAQRGRARFDRDLAQIIRETF